MDKFLNTPLIKILLILFRKLFSRIQLYFVSLMKFFPNVFSRLSEPVLQAREPGDELPLPENNQVQPTTTTPPVTVKFVMEVSFMQLCVIPRNCARKYAKIVCRLLRKKFLLLFSTNFVCTNYIFFQPPRILTFIFSGP